jgi:hypothetical protein
VENVSEWVDMYSSVAALPLNTLVINDDCLNVAFNYLRSFTPLYSASWPRSSFASTTMVFLLGLTATFNF